MENEWIDCRTHFHNFVLSSSGLHFSIQRSVFAPLFHRFPSPHPISESNPSQLFLFAYPSLTQSIRIRVNIRERKLWSGDITFHQRVNQPVSVFLKRSLYDGQARSCAPDWSIKRVSKINAMSRRTYLQTCSSKLEDHSDPEVYISVRLGYTNIECCLLLLLPSIVPFFRTFN